MKLKPETIKLCEKLHDLYQIDRTFRGDEHKYESFTRIAEVEQDLQLHVQQNYEIPWFRIYTYWLMSRDEAHMEGPGLD